MDFPRFSRQKSLTKAEKINAKVYKTQKHQTINSNEFKTKAVQLSLMDDVQVQEVAQTLDIHPFMLSRWRKEYREGVVMPDKRTKELLSDPCFF